MSIEVGDIVDGKITGTTNFGAFVALPEGQNGLIHISEVSNDYVEKVEDYVEKGQEVKVKVLTVKEGKIGLSLKALEPKKEVKKEYKKEFKKDFVPRKKEVAEWTQTDKSSDQSFEDKLSQFMKDSSEKNNVLRSRDGKRGAGQRYRSKN